MAANTMFASATERMTLPPPPPTSFYPNRIDQAIDEQVVVTSVCHRRWWTDICIAILLISIEASLVGLHFITLLRTNKQNRRYS